MIAFLLAVAVTAHQTATMDRVQRNIPTLELRHGPNSYGRSSEEYCLNGRESEPQLAQREGMIAPWVVNFIAGIKPRRVAFAPAKWAHTCASSRGNTEDPSVIRIY